MSYLTLYFAPPSPPSRTVLLLARYLKLDIEVKYINLAAGDQMSPEFIKMNPQHKVPVLVDGDFVLTESRAIIAYLVNSRAPGSDLYPTEPKARAIIDHRIQYEMGNVFRKLGEVVGAILFRKEKSISQGLKDELKGIMKTVDGFFEGHEYFASDNLTIADFPLAVSITTFKEMGYIFDEYERINKWYEKIQNLPNFDENEAGAKIVGGLVKSSADEPLF